jgi:hypothetical protein
LNRKAALDLLIACAAPAGGAPARALAPLAVDVAWAELDGLAHFHRVQPLMRRRLLDADLAPPALCEDWEAGLRANAIRNLHLTRVLLSLVRRFQAAGLSLLPHKGALLALSAYGDLSLRAFADLDILVPEAMLDQALALLSEEGFSRDPPLAWLSAKALKRWTGEVSCRRESDDVAVDLHWRLTPPHYPVQLEAARLWPHIEAQAVAGTAVPSLAPEALFLLLAVHGAKHAWEALGWLADLAWLVAAKPAFDWDFALRLAEGAGCRRPFLLGATLIGQVFETPVRPSACAAAKADPAVARLVGRVRRRWLHGEPQSPHSPELLAFAADLSASRLALTRHLAGLILNPTERDWRAFRLPEPAFALYAPARIARLAGKYLSPVRGIKPTKL